MRTLIGYILVITVSVVGAIRSRRLLFQWVCLEVNILRIIPILCIKSSKEAVGVTVKYFITQRAASLVFLVGLIIIKKGGLMVLLRVGAILFKIGVPPFQSWLLGIIIDLGFMEMFVLFSVQKFIPLVIIRSIEIPSGVLWLVVLSSIVQLLSSVGLSLTLHYVFFLSSVGNGV